VTQPKHTWEWWAGVVGEPIYNLAAGCKTREEAIRTALAEANSGDEIQIVEAVSSSAAKYEGAEEVPFIRMRNHEVIGRKGIYAAAVAS